MSNATSARAGSGTFWDAKMNVMTRTVLPGDHAIEIGGDVALVTLLGSCVAACVRDPKTGTGGLNHFLLPDGAGADKGSARYGVNAMELLINDILKQGGRKDRLEAKVFGGGNVIDVSAEETVGDRNGRFVTEYLRREGITLIAADLGGARARRVFYFPTSGRATVLKLPVAENRRLRQEELALKARAQSAPRSGGVELF
ncbi:MAG: chemoreceptor glutamine deamidase CheD [Pseudomonadota bacterium]